MVEPKIFNNISKAKTPRELFSLLEDKVAVHFEVGFLKVFVWDEPKGRYVLRENITSVKTTSGEADSARLKAQDPIIAHLLDVKKAVLVKEVDENIAVALTKGRKAFLSSLRDQLIDFQAEVCVPGFAQDRLVAVFILGKKLSKEEFSNQEIMLFSSLASQSAAVISKFNSVKKEIELFVNSLRKVIQALEAKDIYTRGHSDRVAQFSMILGHKLRDELDMLPYGEISLYYAAELHDLGKVHLSDAVLKKAGKLSPEEWEQMKRHPIESVEIVKPLKKWFGKIILDGVLYHHENFDGTGYPYGKKRDEVNILARIIRVADSFDAMITDRPYRKALTHHQVISELKAGRGTKYDPKVIDAFLEAYKEGLFKDIFYSQLESEGQNEI